MIAGHVEIAVGASRRADADVFVGKPHVQRVLVGFRVDRDGLDPELAAGEDHPQRDLAAVGDQDLLEHQLQPDREQPLAVLHRLAVLDVDVDDLAVVFGVDLVHQLHRFDDAEHLALVHAVADSKQRLRSGLGRAIERADDRRLDNRQLGAFLGCQASATAGGAGAAARSAAGGGAITAVPVRESAAPTSSGTGAGADARRF